MTETAEAKLVPASRPRSTPAWWGALVDSVGVLFVPASLPRVVTTRRAGIPLLVIFAVCLASALVVGPKLDVRAQIPTEEMVAGQMVPVSEMDLETRRDKAQKLARVKLGLGAGLMTPMAIVLLGMAVGALGRYAGGRPPPRAALSLAAHASLPIAVRAALTGLAAATGPPIRPDAVASLVPPGPLAAHVGGPLARLLGQADVFTLWVLVLLVVGFPAATGMKRVPGTITIVVGTVLYLAVSNLILGPR